MAQLEATAASLAASLGVSISGYESAPDVATAVARMYYLGGLPTEPLQSNGMETVDAYRALGRHLGLDLSTVPTKASCAKAIATSLHIEWNRKNYVSPFGDVNLDGLNCLIDSCVVRYIHSGRKPRRSFLRRLSSVNPALSVSDLEESNVSATNDELELSICEQIGLLLEDGPLPQGIEVDQRYIEAYGGRNPEVGQWRPALAAVQGWLHLGEDISGDTSEAFDTSAARLLKVGDINAVPQDEYYSQLLDRLERANDYRRDFLDDLEDEAEGRTSLAAASAAWEERWESNDIDADDVVGGPIFATATTWSISTLIDRVLKKRLDLAPSYQRADVWPTGDAQLLIVSLLRGIPLPSIILRKVSSETVDAYEIIDGKQRLTSILRFTGFHPKAEETIRQLAKEWGEDEHQLLDEFRNDYLRFKKHWKRNSTESLTATKERELYFPFKLKKDQRSTLTGELEKLQGRYYSEIKDVPIPLLGGIAPVEDLFTSSSVEYSVPVIVYGEATPRQIHDVFSLYNRQGKRLNAEEIRNAAYHELDFMKAILAVSGDADDYQKVAPFLEPYWDDLKTTGKALSEGAYDMPLAGYKRTKLLSWLASSLLLDGPGVMSKSTANHIDALFRRLQDNKFDLLNRRERIVEFMMLLDGAVDCHQMVQEWPVGFPNQTGKRWQELQLVATLIAFAAAYAVRGEDAEDLVDERQGELLAALSSKKRPTKTQTKKQWEFIGDVVDCMLPALGIDLPVADQCIRDKFGSSGLANLVYFAREAIEEEARQATEQS